MPLAKHVLIVLALSFAGVLPCGALGDVLSGSATDQLAMQRFWQARLPIAAGDRVARVSLLDDNMYVLTEGNRAYAVHTRTGVLRWSRAVADPDLTVRGPTHAEQFVFFTTPGGVRVLNRRTGEPAGETRKLHGVIIEVAHDIVEINIGRLHGVRSGDVLEVFVTGPGGRAEGRALARVTITSIKPRRSKGRLARLDATRKPQSGDTVLADVVLPLPSVNLPFAASSAAVADNAWIYVGAANQRFYCLNILSGLQRWQLRTPKTVSAAPVLDQEYLYYAGQNGRVVSCTKKDRVRHWTFETEGPIFADPVLTDDSVFIASSDRSLYCLNRQTGRRLWRERFDNPLRESPIASAGNVYQPVPQAGLFVLDAATGHHRWRRSEGGRFLLQQGSNVYLWNGGADAGGRLVVVDVATGEEKRGVGAGTADFAAADQVHALLLLVSRDGDMMCLRSTEAPHLEPAELAEVLKNDRAARLAASVASARDAGKAPAESPKNAARKRADARLRYLFEDWFTTRSTARPVGGHGLVKIEGEEKEAEAADGEAEVEEAEDAGEEDEEGVTEGDEDEDDEGVESGEENSDDEAADEEDAGANDDEGDDEGTGDNDDEEEDDDG
ncbi:MAG: PQQ-binding-like beta-propeller repeat protein [Phycisphaerae bacterium]